MINPTDAEWFLPLARPMPEGMKPPTYVLFQGKWGGVGVPVLGAPVHRNALLSPEARAVLEAAGKQADSSTLNGWLGYVAFQDACAATNQAYRAYARSLTPRDPLAEAREALKAAKAATYGSAGTRRDSGVAGGTTVMKSASEYIDDALAALAKLGDKA